MAFHRFENLEMNFLTPHLSSARGPVIEGKYMYFCLVHKTAGTGSELHYHPNELLIFPVGGRDSTRGDRDREGVYDGALDIEAIIETLNFSDNLHSQRIGHLVRGCF